MICITLDCVRPTQSSIIQTIHQPQCWFGVFFNQFYQNVFFVIIVIYAYFIYISEGSVETDLQCGGMYNNHIIANCLQSVPVKEF